MENKYSQFDYTTANSTIAPQEYAILNSQQSVDKIAIHSQAVTSPEEFQKETNRVDLHRLLVRTVLPKIIKRV
jgi:hypothetical protein